MYIDTLNPAFELSISWDSLNLYGAGRDSLDIDTDGVFDLILSCSLLNQDSIHLLAGQEPNPYPYYKVELRNGYLVQATVESVSGLGDIYWVEPLDFKNKITEKETWTAGPTYLWKENGTPGFPTFGPWYNLNEIQYIAFNRMNKLGWMELDPTDRTHIKVNIIAREK